MILYMKKFGKAFLKALVLLTLMGVLTSATCTKQKGVHKITSFTMMKYGMDERHELTFYIIDTGRDGMNVAIISGIHGNEIAAQGASFDLMNNFDFPKGKFLFIPKANKLACDLNDRFPGAKHPGFYSQDSENYRGDPDYHDMNRIFPGDTAGTITKRIAAVITEVLDEFKPDLIIDLHESMNLHTNPGNVGNTLLTNSINLYAAESAVAALNASGLTPEADFVARRASTEGMAITVYDTRYNIPTFLIETTRFEGVTPLIHVPFQQRIAQHRFLIKHLMSTYGAL